jgi:hypothetical protein
VNQHRPVVGRVKTLQLKREVRRWYVIVVTEAETVPLASTGRSVGVDMGVARFLTTSDGEVVANPRFLDAAQKRIVDLRAVSCVPGPAPATAGGLSGRSSTSGALSATSGGTSTTRPPAGRSTPATRSRWKTCA